MLRPLLFCAFLSFCAHLVRAQQAKEYAFKHFSTDNGLASNTVYAITQDEMGYIWIGTETGLQRYDGNTFLTFNATPKLRGALPSDKITRVYRDKKNRIWVVGDQNKIGTFDTKRFVFRRAFFRTSVPDQYIRKFYEMPGGELLIALDDGTIFRYIESTHEFAKDDDLISCPPKWHFNDIACDSRNKKFWVSTDSGLVQYDPVTRHLNYRGHNIDHNPVIKQLGKQVPTYSVFVDGKGNIVFDFWPPLAGASSFMRYNTRENTVDSFSFGPQLGYHEVQGRLRQANGRFWLFGHAFLGEWKDGTKTLLTIPNEYKNEQSIKFDYAFSAHEDKDQNIWLATDNGVYVFNPDAQVFNSFRLIRPDEAKPREAPVQAVAETPEGNILAGCWGAGLYYYDKLLNPITLPPGLREKASQLSIWDMTVHSMTGELWITLQRGGIVVYNFKTHKLVEVYPDIFMGSTIRQMDNDTLGNLWFGTNRGRLVKWDYKKAANDPTKGYEVVAETGMIHKVHYDYQGYVWVATLGKGLLKFNARTNKLVKQFTETGPPGERLFMNSPGDMTYYNDTTLLVSAGCINIINTKTNKITYLGTEEGLPSNTVQSLQKDKYGIVWAGMLNGICRLNIEKKVISYYDRRDGLAVDKFSMTGVDHLHDGRIMFFTDHNFMVFDPKRFIQLQPPPRPSITLFKLMGLPLQLDSLQKTGHVVLKYNNNSVSIGFSALTYLQQRKLHYFYMLENLDKDWIHTDHPIEVIYNYLPPGEYTFKVKSENADGITSTEIASLPIIIRPPFWKTWWFYCLVILDIILVLYLIDRERMKKLRSLLQLRSQIARSLHHEIHTTLSNINVLSEIAKIKADRNVEQSKEFIDQISDKSKIMIESMEDMLWSIQPENDSMEKTLIRIKEVTEGLQSDYDVDIDLIVDNKLQTLELDMKVRYELFFYYKEALTFLLKSRVHHQVFVNFNLVKSRLLLEILSEANTLQPNFKEQFRGAVQKRVEALNASLDVLSDHKSFAAVLVVTLR